MSVTAFAYFRASDLARSLIGWVDRDLSALGNYVRTASRHLNVPVPHNYPIFGHDAFLTGTGVHAAAVIKALKKGDRWLADRVYSGVPAGDFGEAQRISVGYMSGRSNVLFWLERHDMPIDRLEGVSRRLRRPPQSRRYTSISAISRR